MSRQGCTVFALALAISACAGDHAPSEPSTGNPSGTTNIVTAVVDGVAWNAGDVTVRQGGGFIYIQATAWPGRGDERQYMALTFQTTVGSIAQSVGVGSPVSAGLGVELPLSAGLGVEFIGGWIASGAAGSGTITLTSLTSTRATGTFAFNGVADRPVSPQIIAVVNGRFDVRVQ